MHEMPEEVNRVGKLKALWGPADSTNVSIRFAVTLRAVGCVVGLKSVDHD